MNMVFKNLYTMDIKKIIKEEIAKVINNRNDNGMDAFVDKEHVQIEELPNGEMICGVE